MPKTRIKKKTNTTGDFQDLGYTLTDDEITKIGEIDNKINKVTSTDNAIARFNGTTGAIQNSKVTITDAGDIYSNGTKVVVESALNGLATETFVTGKIAELVNAAPAELDTLKELADGITANKTIIESVNEAIGNKAPNNHASTATTYGVATTSAYGHVKINNGDVNTVASSNGVAAGMDHTHSNYVPTSRTINSKALSGDITLTASDVGAEPAFTKNTAFNKNFGTTSGTVCQGNDSRLSNARTPTAHTHTKSEITDFPTIPTALSQLSADATHRTVTDTEKATWNSKSSFSGSYTDLTNKPTIPTVNNGTLTIQKNGTKVQTFTANQSSNVTANITVPTKTSDLTNDSGFITSDDLPSGGGVTSVVGQTGDVTAAQIKTGIQTTGEGFAIGRNASATNGGAIGYNTSATQGFAGGTEAKETEGGGAVGQYSSTTTGGAVGSYASAANGGGAVGQSAVSYGGGAIGYDAEADNGFAGGYEAKATAMHSVQLGQGTNSEERTLKFLSYQLLNSKGIIPYDRNAITQKNYSDFSWYSNSITLFNGETTPAATGNITIQGGKALKDYRMIFVLGSGDNTLGAEWMTFYGWQLDKIYQIGSVNKTKISSVKIASCDTSGVWNITPESLASTTTLTVTGENMKINMIIGVE